MFGNDSSKNTKWGFAFITLYNRDAIERKIKKMTARGTRRSRDSFYR